MPLVQQKVFYGEGGYGEGYYDDALSQAKETTAVNRSLTPLPPPVFTGMKLQQDVIIGDLVLNRIDSNNVIWVCTDIDGWWVHPDPDVPDVTRGWRDGSYDARGRWQARVLTLNGSILPPDPSYSAAARDELIAATSLVYTGAWLKTVENPTRAAYVRLSGRPQISSVTARGRLDFSIGLRAADPIKYSWNDADLDGYDSVNIPCKSGSPVQSGSATITNDGNIGVSMFLVVSGPTVGTLSIVNETNGEVMTIVGDLRGSETRSVTNKQINSGIATLTLSTMGDFVDGDTITVSGVDSTFDGEYEVYAVNGPLKTISYLTDAGNVSSSSASGSVYRAPDALEIDTYEREVAYNGLTLGARVYVDTLTDWLTLEPGDNVIQFTDEGTANGAATLDVYYRSGWIG